MPVTLMCALKLFFDCCRIAELEHMGARALPRGAGEQGRDVIESGIHEAMFCLQNRHWAAKARGVVADSHSWQGRGG